MAAFNGMPEGQRTLTPDEFRAELQWLKLCKNCPSEQTASLFAARLPLEGRDLLHEAVCRALTSRQCCEAITVGQFLNGILWSIASTAKRAADARDAQEVFMPKEEVAERLGLGGYHVISAEQELENERIRKSLAEKIAQLAAKSERHARLYRGHRPQSVGAAVRRIRGRDAGRAGYLAAKPKAGGAENLAGGREHCFVATRLSASTHSQPSTLTAQYPGTTSASFTFCPNWAPKTTSINENGVCCPLPLMSRNRTRPRRK